MFKWIKSKYKRKWGYIYVILVNFFEKAHLSSSPVTINIFIKVNKNKSSTTWREIFFLVKQRAFKNNVGGLIVKCWTFCLS